MQAYYRHTRQLVATFLKSARGRFTMPANVEIKAKVTEFGKFQEKAAELSQSSGTVIEQVDTFFNVPNGRLKLRELNGQQLSQLIFYSRPDETGPKASVFHITEVKSADDLKKTLGPCLGIKGVVKKRRHLFMVGQTRIHADEVDGLGNFMELEVQMKEGQSIEEGNQIAKELMDQLGVKSGDLMEGAYMDHLLKKQKAQSEHC